MKVLILCNDFPPLNSIGAQRPYSWFCHLKKQGIEPVVITKNWKGHSATPQDILRTDGANETVVEHTECGDVLRVPLVITPFEKLLLTYGENKFKYLRKTITLFYIFIKWISLRFDQHRTILKETDSYVKKNKVDGIIITGEPFILFKYGFLLSKKYSIPWIADYRDGWKLNYSRDSDKGVLMKTIRWWEFRFEKKYIQTATLITSIDPILACNLSALFNKPSEVIYNGFDGMYKGPADTVTDNLPLTLNHTGTLTSGQRVEVLLQAVKELLEEKQIAKEELLIRFIGLGYFSDRLQRVINFDAKVKETIVITPRISREEVLKMNAGADYLITFSEAVHKMINAKTYDYIAVKRPILVIPDDNSILSDLVQKLNAGQSPQGVKELKQILLSAIQLKRGGKLIPPPDTNEQEALFYTREKQTEVLARVLNKYFGS